MKMAIYTHYYQEKILKIQKNKYNKQKINLTKKKKNHNNNKNENLNNRIPFNKKNKKNK